MKNKTWALILGGVLLACILLGVWLLKPGQKAEKAEIWSEGELKFTLDLAVDRQVTVKTDRGTNVITVKNGKIAVTEADCPDGYCMNRGYCDNGAQIVCLPNRLVIKFTGKQSLDGISG